MADVDGVPYRPGGAAEVDELMDLYAIWEEQRQRTRGGTGAGKDFESWD